MSIYLHTFPSEPVRDFFETKSESTLRYVVDPHIEEFVRDELLNTLKFLVSLHNSGAAPLEQPLYQQLASTYTELYKTTSWEKLFDTEQEFLTFLRTVCNLRDTCLNSLLYSLIVAGVHPDKADLALQELMRDYDISFMDLQYRQLTAPRY